MRVTRSLTLILLAFFLEESSPVCLDKFALSSVDVLVHKQRNSRAVIHRNEHFNVLDNYISIDVINSNVSELCEESHPNSEVIFLGNFNVHNSKWLKFPNKTTHAGRIAEAFAISLKLTQLIEENNTRIPDSAFQQGMIKNFPVLETLSFINANLTVIEPGTFQNVPSLKYLSLSVNLLAHIPRGVFNTIPSLKVIYLTRNQIETIEDAAFSQMANLKTVHLEHNKISQLSGNIFFGSPILSSVDFSYNQLSTIGKNAFDDLRPGSSIRSLNILLKRNQIKTIDREALNQLIPVNLHLEGNHISTISDIVSSAKETSQLYFANNKIECISDDVLELVKATDIKIYVQNNPVQCACIERVEAILNGEIRGEINIATTLPCNANYPFFGNDI